MDINELLGQIIKTHRVKQGLTQAELGDRVGVGEQTIYYYERGKRKMNVDTFFLICEILHLSPYEVQKTLGTDGAKNSL